MDLSKVYQCPVTSRFYDPLRVQRDLFRLSAGEVNDWIRSGDRDNLITLARKVFGLPDIDPVTGRGVLDAEVIEVLDRYTEWLSGKVETVQISPTSVPCTDCP